MALQFQPTCGVVSGAHFCVGICGSLKPSPASCAPVTIPQPKQEGITSGCSAYTTATVSDTSSATAKCGVFAVRVGITLNKLKT
jgi:hypothetical protein